MMVRQDFINTINDLRETISNLRMTIKTLQKTIEDLNENEKRHKKRSTVSMRCWSSSRTSANISSPSTTDTSWHNHLKC